MSGHSRRAPDSFQTPRLEAERIAPEHLADLCVLHRDLEAMRELGGVRSDDETERYLRRNLLHWSTHGFGVWMLRRPEGGPSVGRVILRWLSTESLHDVEIGFALLPRYWGQGLATEAGSACLSIARDALELRTLIGVTTPTNRASQRVLTKLGFSHEGDTIVESTACYLFRSHL